MENGDINWNCPCLGGMATGPCGVDFREAFSCFHYSTEEPKGSECFEVFAKMQECMSSHPDLYGSSKAEEEDALLDEHNFDTEIEQQKQTIDEQTVTTGSTDTSKS